MTLELFISYSTRHEQYAKLLEDELRKWGFTTWIYSIHGDTAKRIKAETTEKIRRADLVLFLITAKPRRGQRDEIVAIEKKTNPQQKIFVASQNRRELVPKKLNQFPVIDIIPIPTKKSKQRISCKELLKIIRHIVRSVIQETPSGIAEDAEVPEQ